MTRVSTIIVTYAELHKPRVVISFYRNWKQQKTKPEFVVAVHSIARRCEKLYENLNWKFPPPFIELTKFIHQSAHRNSRRHNLSHLPCCITLKILSVKEGPVTCQSMLISNLSLCSIKADVGPRVLKVKPQIRRVSGYIILCMYYLHSMYSSHPLSTLFSQQRL